MAKAIKLNNNRNTYSSDLWIRPNSFLHNTVTVRKPINNTPLALSRGTDTADRANMGRPSFLRSNPVVYVPDFDLAQELLQEQQGQKVHLSDNTVRSITGINKKVVKLQKMLDNPTTLTPTGFAQLVDKIKALDYPDRIELEDAIIESGTTLAAQILVEINKIAPPVINNNLNQAPSGAQEEKKDLFKEELKEAVKKKSKNKFDDKLLIWQENAKKTQKYIQKNKYVALDTLRELAGSMGHDDEKSTRDGLVNYIVRNADKHKKEIKKLLS